MENKENLVFGWVSPQIQGNWANWSSWKDYGDEEDAKIFYRLTSDEAYEQGLTWFDCIDESEELEGNDP